MGNTTLFLRPKQPKKVVDAIWYTGECKCGLVSL